jgi:hypothetical protein
MLMTLESHSVEEMMLAIRRLLQQELQLLPLHLLAQPPLASLLVWL